MEGYAIGPVNVTHHNATVIIEHDVALMIVNAFIGCCGLLGNGLVCFVLILRRRKFRSNTGLLIFNQSLIDLISSAVFSSLRFGPDSYALPSIFWSDAICKVWASEYILWSLFYVSTSNLVVISLDRYFAMCHPIRHRSTFTKRRVQFAMGAAWAIGFIYESYWIGLNHFMPITGACKPQWPNATVQMAVGILLFILEYLFPIFLMGFCYINIICVIHRRRHSNLNTQVENFLRARKNVSITLCLVAVSFFVCWTPTEVSYLMFNCGWGYDFQSIFHDAVVVLVQLNLCVNPWIYSFKYEQFQRQTKDIFCSCCCDSTANGLCEGMSVTSHHPRTRSASQSQVTMNTTFRAENGKTETWIVLC
ncbi:galanin receptor type 1-like [Amphiura filiformis]|uniref:galanin receptor type 1-like n=1 Tax=Amphiura filiformis TaxID=82378 RepID=UPI003B214883